MEERIWKEGRDKEKSKIYDEVGRRCRIVTCLPFL